MVDFSLWDIFRNLLLALRWTVVLSLIAFVGGGECAIAIERRRALGFAGRIQAVNPRRPASRRCPRWRRRSARCPAAAGEG